MPRGQMQHIEFTVSDLVRSAPFYGDVLGALGYRRLRIDMETALWQIDFENGTHCTIGLRQADNGDSARAAGGPREFTWAAANRGEVDGLHARLKEIGAPILAPPAVHPAYEPGYYAVFFADPDGLRLALAHAPRSR